jgi:benzoyl-CoA reductase/2-hydroxyglutaryl-CoA dehydratase subunit BcrC/BadD/HgdB
MAKGFIPVPDLVATSSYSCDMGSKADELLHEKYGHRAVYVDGSMDSRWGHFPRYEPEQVEFLGTQLNKLFATASEVFGVEVNRKIWGKAMAAGTELAGAVIKLQELVNTDPRPISSTEVELAKVLPVASTGRARTEGLQAIHTLTDEVRGRIEKHIGIMDKGAPVVMTFLTSFSDPSIVRMMEDAGLAVSIIPASITLSTDTTVPMATLGEEIADRQFKMGTYHSSYGLVKIVEQGVLGLGVDGLIWTYLYNCRPMALTSHFLKKRIETSTGMPIMALEMDIYDSRNYTASTLRTKVEVFAEMLRARKTEVGD